MYPPSPYALSRGSFETPIDAPASHPLDQPLYQVCINQSWMPIIAGALKQLELQSTWKVADDNALLDVQGRVFDLLSQFGLQNPGCGSLAPSMLCISGDFHDMDYGFAPTPGGVCSPTWAHGGAWVSCHDAGSNTDWLQVRRVFDAATYIRSSSFLYNVALLNPTDVVVDFFYHGVNVFHQTGTLMGGGNITFTSTVNQPADEWRISIHRTGPPGTNPIGLFTWQLCYTGAFPLAIPPLPTCKFFNFVASQSGYTVWAERPYGSWVSGVGWSSQPNQIGKSSIYIGKHFDYAGIVGSVTVHGHMGNTPNQLSINNEFINNLTVSNIPVGDYTQTFPAVGWSVDPSQRFLINALYTGATTPGDASMRIYDVEVCANPAVFA